jgi:uncharacterized protein YdaU (DUF1376 family)
MPFYVGDYISDTAHLSTIEHGAYILLLLHYWRKGGLPADERQLAAIAKMNHREWHKHRDTLQAFFYDGWKHKRVEHELKRQGELSAKRAIAGAKGGVIANIHRYRRK